jgi:short-subunit dehydrogenase
MTLNNTVVLITGATHTIGSAFAEYFGRHLNATDSLIILTSRSQVRADTLAGSLKTIDAGLNVIGVELDFERPDKEYFERTVFNVS